MLALTWYSSGQFGFKSIRIGLAAGVCVGFYREGGLSGVHLLGEVNDLRSIPGVFIQDYVMTVQIAGCALFGLVK